MRGIIRWGLWIRADGVVRWDLGRTSTLEKARGKVERELWGKLTIATFTPSTTAACKYLTAVGRLNGAW